VTSCPDELTSTIRTAASTVRASAGGACPDWPYVSALEFGALATAIGSARAHTRTILAEWGLRHLADDAATLVSELLTNALHASWTLPHSPPVALRLLANRHALVIEAWDQCVEGYDLMTCRPTDDSEHGRGLMVVAALSNRWGVRRASLNYKVVWCEIKLC
jgi:anti-sigma regulatory factor (Ser/Thr protein kinase)